MSPSISPTTAIETQFRNFSAINLKSFEDASTPDISDDGEIGRTSHVPVLSLHASVARYCTVDEKLDLETSCRYTQSLTVFRADFLLKALSYNLEALPNPAIAHEFVSRRKSRILAPPLRAWGKTPEG
jgi:hypothetical protein